MTLNPLKRYAVRHPELLRRLQSAKSAWRYCVSRFFAADAQASNAALCRLSSLLRLERSLGRPILLTVEPTNICDQRCTVCETGLGILGRKPASMDLAQFRTILDKFDDSLEQVMLYFMGETFLNKDAYAMCRQAANRGLHVSACTNGNHVDPEALVRSGIAEIQFQIAGTTQDVHGIYRVGGRLESTLKAVSETVRLRNALANELRSNPFPLRIGLGFILFRHNEHQSEDFVRLARSLGVDEFQIINPCVRTVEQGRELLPTDKTHWIYDPQEFERGMLRMRNRPNNQCEWIYTTMTVQVNGDVVPCCRDPKGQWILGNILHQGADEIWNGPAYRKLRAAVTTRQASLPLCALCEGYVAPQPRTPARS